MTFLKNDGKLLIVVLKIKAATKLKGQSLASSGNVLYIRVKPHTLLGESVVSHVT